MGGGFLDATNPPIAPGYTKDYEHLKTIARNGAGGPLRTDSKQGQNRWQRIAVVLVWGASAIWQSEPQSNSKRRGRGFI